MTGGGAGEGRYQHLLATFGKCSYLTFPRPVLGACSILISVSTYLQSSDHKVRYSAMDFRHRILEAAAKVYAEVGRSRAY